MFNGTCSKCAQLLEILRSASESQRKRSFRSKGSLGITSLPFDPSPTCICSHMLCVHYLAISSIYWYIYGSTYTYLPTYLHLPTSILHLPTSTYIYRHLPTSNYIYLLIYIYLHLPTSTYYLHLPTSTYIYLHLPTSTYYLHLPTSTYIYRHLPTTYIYLHLPTSTDIYLHLPTSTYIYLHLPTSTDIYLHLPTSTYYLHLPTSTDIYRLPTTYIYLHLPTSTDIYLHLPTSTYIYLHLPTSTDIYRHLPTSTYYLHLPTSTYIYRNLPTSTYYLHLPTSTDIYLHLPTSTYIYLHLPTSTDIYLHLPTSTYYLHLPTSTDIYLHLPTSTYSRVSQGFVTWVGGWHCEHRIYKSTEFQVLAAKDGISLRELPSMEMLPWKYLWSPWIVQTKRCPSQLNVQVRSNNLSSSVWLYESQPQQTAQHSAAEHQILLLLLHLLKLFRMVFWIRPVGQRLLQGLRKKTAWCPENPKPGWYFKMLRKHGFVGFDHWSGNPEVYNEWSHWHNIKFHTIGLGPFNPCTLKTAAASHGQPSHSRAETCSSCHRGNITWASPNKKHH